MSRVARIAGAVVVVALAAAGASAEDVTKRIRIGLSIGGFDGSDNVHSPSANVRNIIDENDQFFAQFIDPRNDSAATSDFGISPQYVGTATISYSFTPNWYIEGSVGYRQGDVSNVEVQAEFNGQPPLGTQPFNFRIFNLNAGTLRQVPVQITAGIRFRPKAALNPYVCAGIGYTFNSFTPSDELDELSANLDASVGGFRQLTIGNSLLDATTFRDLTAIRVESPDAPEWHAGGGVEISFKRKWVVFLDARYLVYSGDFAIRVDGQSTELGISVPADIVHITDPGAGGPFGAYEIRTGGLIDGGSLVPRVGAPPGTNCSTDPGSCQFTGPKDGIPDPGIYYVHAGRIRFDGVTFQAGVKFTF